MKDDDICAMRSGLEFGKQLNLSPEVAFSCLDISHFLALPTYFVRPFKHIRCVLIFGSIKYIHDVLGTSATITPHEWCSILVEY